jgi:hypothetical protein
LRYLSCLNDDVAAEFGDFPIYLNSSRINGFAGSGGHFGANSVAWDEGNFVGHSFHCKTALSSGLYVIRRYAA